MICYVIYASFNDRQLLIVLEENLSCFAFSGVFTKFAYQRQRKFITKTCLYKFDPLQPHFYIVKLGFAGVYIIFLILLNNIDCGYSLEPPRRGGSNEYPQSIF